MKKLLFITRHYLSDNNGGANATKGFVHAFAQLCSDITLIYPEHDGQDSASYVPQGIHLMPCYDHRSIVQKGLDIYRGRLHRLTDFVRNHLKGARAYNTIVIDHSLTAANILASITQSGARIITIHHNVERDYLKDNLPPLLYRYPMVYFSQRAEREALLSSHHNLTLTEHDADTFSRWYPNRDLHLSSIGISEYRGLPDKAFEPSRRGHHFVISGSLCFRQSLEPIIDFVSHYYPTLKATCPEATLTIAGRNPAQPLYDACQPWPEIRIIANPDDMAEVIRQADIYLCPISAGSGIKLRLMDGLKEGKPVICHEVSTYGYEPLVEIGIIHRYDDPESFRKALSDTLSQPHNPATTYNTFRQYFSTEHLARRIQEALR